MAFVKLGELNFHYRCEGAGQPVLLLHGWCNNINYWDREFARLQRNFKVYAYDARGHGLSSAPEGQSHYGLDAFAADLKNFIRALSLKHPILVGHSLGAATAVAVAAHRPKMAQRLVLASADFGYQPRTKAEEASIRRNARTWAKIAKAHGLAEWARNQIAAAQVPRFIAESETAQQQHIERYAHQPLQGFVGVAHTLPWWDKRLRAWVKKLAAPTHVIIGSDDNMFAAGAKLSAQQLKNGSLTVIEGGFHDLGRSHPEEFTAAIRDAVFAR